MNRQLLRAAWLAVALGACVSDPMRIPDQDVTPLDVLDEHLEQADGSRRCEASDLRASYVDDESGDRGRIRVAFAGDQGGARVTVEVQGAAPSEGRISEGSELLSTAFIQEAQAVSDGEIDLGLELLDEAIGMAVTGQSTPR